MKLENKVIVVTGGTGVLGYSFNKAIAKEGGIVCILGRNKSLAEERADEIVNEGGQAIGLYADVLIEEEGDTYSLNKNYFQKISAQ